MKYKMLTAATLMIIGTAEKADAACKCAEWINGSTSCSDFSKLNPHYWSCRIFFATLIPVCEQLLCQTNYEAKMAINEEACVKGGTGQAIKNCKEELEKDVTYGVDALTSDIKSVLEKTKNQIKQEADTEAEKY